MDSFRHGASHHLWPPGGALIRGIRLVQGVLILLGLATCFPPTRSLAFQPGNGPGKSQAGTPGQSGLTFEYSRSSVDFGDVVVGDVATRQVTITNDGSSPLTLSTYQVSGNAFSVTGLGLPVTLARGQSLFFSARFAPTVAGAFIGSVILEGAGSKKSITALRGTGGVSAGVLWLSPASVDFGNVVVGGDAQLPILVQNRGSDSVTISAASVTGNGYTLSNLNLPVILKAGESTSFTITFTPTGSGASAATVSLTSSGGNSPFSLSGNGLVPSEHAHYVKLSWTDSTSPGVTEYDVYRGTISGGPYSEIATVSGTSTGYLDHGVAAGGTYYYVVTAVTGTEQSGYSNEAMAHIP